MTIQLHGQNYYSMDDLPLSVIHAPILEQYPFHSHDFTELVVTLGGTGWHITDDNRYPIAAGDVFVVKGSTGHGYSGCEQLDLFNVLFDASGLSIQTSGIYKMPAYYALFALEPNAREAAGNFHHHLKLSENDLSQIMSILLQLESELDECQSGYEGMAIALFMQIVIFLTRRYAMIDGSELRKMLGLGKVLGHIDRHIEDKISLEQMANMAGMSVSTLQRSFRDALGTSPMEYVIRKRLDRSAELLVYTDATIAEIAFGVGFWDGNYFSRLFKQRFGYAPRDFRKTRRCRIVEATNEPE